MSALIHEDIVRLLDHEDVTKRLVITPLLDRERQIGPGSIDLRLGTEFLEVPRQDNQSIDPFGGEDQGHLGEAERKSYVPLGDKYIIHPGQFVLGATLEFLVMPADLTGQVLSRSSWGRLGLLVATAVAVQPGFKGVLTLELVNTGSIPIVLRPGLRVAQLQLWSARKATELPYGAQGKYNAPLGPESNRLAWEDSEREVLHAISNRMHARPPLTRPADVPPTNPAGGTATTA
jgi:dCTP deaminase